MILFDGTSKTFFILVQLSQDSANRVETTGQRNGKNYSESR